MSPFVRAGWCEAVVHIEDAFDDHAMVLLERAWGMVGVAGSGSMA